MPIAGLVLLALISARGQAGPEAGPDATVLFQDDFASGALDEAKWLHTIQNDFETEVVDIADGRLRMAASSVGTDDRTVKFHGVRTAEPVVDLSGGVSVSFDLDWNDQANGCYMAAGAYICPTVADNPREESNWLRIQYIGVPPGKNARCLVSARVAGRERRLLTEDWPQERTGRKIGLQHLEVTLDRDAILVNENGKLILQADELNLPFGNAYLYLQHTTHSNYRLREVLFDNVVVAK